MKVETFNIEVKSLSFGSEDIILTFGNQEIPFYASYIGPEPISSLVESLITLEERAYPNEQEARGYIKWEDEPGFIDFELCANLRSNHININIDFDNESSGEDSKTAKWDFEMPYSLYRNTIINAALKVIKEYGINGINDSWCDGKDTFPICSLMSLLGAKSSIQEETDSHKSDVFQELKLLEESLKTI